MHPKEKGRSKQIQWLNKPRQTPTKFPQRLCTMPIYCTLQYLMLACLQLSLKKIITLLNQLQSLSHCYQLEQCHHHVSLSQLLQHCPLFSQMLQHYPSLIQMMQYCPSLTTLPITHSTELAPNRPLISIVLCRKCAEFNSVNIKSNTKVMNTCLYRS